MKNKFEMGLENIPSKESVLEIINAFAENAVVVNEKSDEGGLYLLEANQIGEKAGEYVQYQYMREGSFKEGQSLESVIHIIFYEDDMPCGGHDIATYRAGTGTWDVRVEDVK